MKKILIPVLALSVIILVKLGADSHAQSVPHQVRNICIGQMKATFIYDSPTPDTWFCVSGDGRVIAEVVLYGNGHYLFSKRD